MNVDKFGINLNKKRKMENIIATHNLTANKLITSIHPSDCATKHYVDKLIENLTNKLKKINESLSQTNTEINSLKNKVDAFSHKLKK